MQIKALGQTPNSPLANPAFEIVGVIADVKNQGLQEPVVPELMVPYTVTGAFERGILVRTGYGADEETGPPPDGPADAIVDNLVEAVSWILRQC